MLVVAAAGLAVNVAAVMILRRHSEHNLNVSAALRHVLADLLGSVGVIVAAAVILITGWEYADPAAGVLIGLLVLGSSWGILRDSTQILLEGSPAEIDVQEVGRAMAAAPGVSEVHDLHVWTITSGFPALAAHVLVARDTDCHAARRELEQMLAERFGLDHTTLQVDHVGGDLLQIESGLDDSRARRLRRSPTTARASTSMRSGATCAPRTGRRACRARSPSARSPDRCASASMRPAAPRRALRRAVTDEATFLWIADLFVLEEHRGRGLGIWLVESLLADPRLRDVRSVLLATADAHGLYERFGFEPVGEPNRLMRLWRRPEWLQPAEKLSG